MDPRIGGEASAVDLVRSGLVCVGQFRTNAWCRPGVWKVRDRLRVKANGSIGSTGIAIARKSAIFRAYHLFDRAGTGRRRTQITDIADAVFITVHLVGVACAEAVIDRIWNAVAIAIAVGPAFRAEAMERVVGFQEPTAIVSFAASDVGADTVEARMVGQNTPTFCGTGRGPSGAIAVAKAAGIMY